MNLTQYKTRLATWARRHKLWLEYGGLALLIMLPLLKPGYILAFDMSWGPHQPDVALTNNTWALHQIVALASAVVPGWIVQKLILLFIFILAGAGAHKLAAVGKAFKTMPSAAYLAGIFYIINPFMYTRFVAGQWLVMFGYALLPWAIRALWELMRQPTWQTSLRALLWAAAIGLTSIHTAGMISLVGVVFFIAQGKRGLKWRLIYSAAAGAGAAVLNSLWLLPALSGHSPLTGQISSFSHSQLHAFQTYGTLFHNPLLSALTLEGFWADGQRRYIIPSHGGVIWGVAILLLGSLIVAGIYKALRSRDRLGASLFIVGLLSLVLGLGIATAWTAPLTEFLIRHVPFYQGYREPHKWLMLLAVAYAYFASQGLVALLDTGKKISRYRLPVLTAALLLPIVVGGVLLLGAHGQLKAAQYPRGWAQAKTVLDAAGPQTRVLVLPWHMYLPISFAGRVVANPADDYFLNHMITGNDPELRGVAAESRHDSSTALYSQYILGHDPTALKAYNVGYVLLLKQADWQTYSWLQQQSGQSRILDNMDIQLYKVTP